MHVNAQQAAQLVDRNERRVRAWIRSGLLPASKVNGTWMIETADLEKVPGVSVITVVKPSRSSSPTLWTDLLAAILARLTAIDARLAQLEHIGSCQERPQWANIPAGPPHHVARNSHQRGRSRSRRFAFEPTVLIPTELPSDAIRLRHFAVAHHVAESTLISQVKARTIPVTFVDAPQHGTRRHMYLTPHQVKQALVLWRMYGQRYDCCPDCPHGVTDEIKEELSDALS